MAQGKTLKEIKQIMDKQAKEKEGLSSVEIAKKKKKEKPYCTRCQSVSAEGFYKSKNKYQTNGYLPYCKSCLGVIAEDYYKKFDGNIESMLYSLCRVVDTPFRNDYAKDTIEKTNARLIVEEAKKEKELTYDEKRLIEIDSYKYYFTNLNTKLRMADAADISFDDSDVHEDAIRRTLVTTGDEKDFEEKIENWKYISSNEGKIKEELDSLKDRFGYHYEEDDLRWLQTEYTEWELGNNINTITMRKAVEDICKQRLEIRKKRARNEKLKDDYDILNKLIADAALKPKDTLASANDTARQTLGMTIKQLEKNKPADSLVLRNKYKDLDGFEKMMKTQFIAPLLRSIGQTDNSYVRAMDDENLKLGLTLSKDELEDTGVYVKDSD